MKNYNGLNNIIIDCIKELFIRNSKECADNIQLDSYLSDLGLDSLDKIELVMDLEKKFDISIPDDDVDNLNDCMVNDIIIYLKENFNIVDIRQERYDKLDKLEDVVKARQN